MTPQETSWRLRLRVVGEEGEPGGLIGTGFAVTDHAALTCAHVVKGLTECFAEPLDGSVTAQRCRIQTEPPGDEPADRPANDMTDGSTDFAVISLPNPVTPAPLGPYEVPTSGTEVEVVGYPRHYRNWERTEVTRGRILGGRDSGRIQVGILVGHPPIVQGYSGGAAVDVYSGRVVGMVTEADEGNRIAWVIPLASIAGHWPPLADYLPRGLLGDAEFRRACDEFRHGHYGDALHRFGEVAKSYPYEADIHYYRVLAALGGQRPGGYQGGTIEKIEQLLDFALVREPDAAHIQALLKLVEEDYYRLRGLRPRVARVFPNIAEISPDHAWEIVIHVPAPECPTWQYLNQCVSRRPS